MKDPEFLAEAQKLNMDVNPLSAKAIDDTARRALRHARRPCSKRPRRRSSK